MGSFAFCFLRVSSQLTLPADYSEASVPALMGAAGTVSE
jgi:hypothetical protein